jgi:hypothetical protein
VICIGNEAVVTQFKILERHLTSGTEGNHERFVKDVWFSDRELKPWHPEHEARDIHATARLSVFSCCVGVKYHL